MIFNYKTISVSRSIELDFKLMKSHAPTIIRNANIGVGGTLIHNETIDPSLITYTAESPAEQEMLNNGISDEMGGLFYYDPVRQKYLSHNTKEIVFYLSGTNQKNAYFYLYPNIPSNTLPYKLFSDHTIVGGEWYTATPVSFTNEMVVELRNNLDSSPIFTMTLNGTYSQFVDNTSNIAIATNTDLAMYIGNVGQTNPVTKVYLKEVAVGY